MTVAKLLEQLCIPLLIQKTPQLPQLSLPDTCLFHFHGAAKQNKCLFVFMKVGQTTADKQEGEL